MTIEESDISCGVSQVYGLYDDDPTNMLKKISRDFLVRKNAAFYLFSDTIRRVHSRGQKLESFIEKNKLGKLIRSSTRMNPNSGNNIAMWIFEPDKVRLRKWWVKNGGEADNTKQDTTTTAVLPVL